MRILTKSLFVVTISDIVPRLVDLFCSHPSSVTNRINKIRERIAYLKDDFIFNNKNNSFFIIGSEVILRCGVPITSLFITCNASLGISLVVFTVIRVAFTYFYLLDNPNSVLLKVISPSIIWLDLLSIENKIRRLSDEEIEKIVQSIKEKSLRVKVLCCPISYEPIKDPVYEKRDCSVHKYRLYERERITQYLRHQEISPFTRKPLKLTDLKECPKYKKFIECCNEKDVLFPDLDVNDMNVKEDIGVQIGIFDDKGKVVEDHTKDYILESELFI